MSEATQQKTLMLVFRNVSATGCDLRGYPAIALADGKRAVLPFAYRQHGDQMLTSKPPAVVPLAPDALAYTALNKNNCIAAGDVARPIVARRIQVRPPNDREDLILTLGHYPILDYCQAGDPGHVINVAPVESTVTAIFPVHG